MEMCSAAAITHSNVQRRALCVNGIFIVIVAVIRMIVFAYLLRSTIWRCTTACFTPNTVRTLRWASFKWVKFNILFDVCDTHAALCAKQFIYLLRNIHMDPFTFISIDCKFSILSTVCPNRTTHFAEQRICAQFEWWERRCVARVSAVNLLRVCRNKIDCSRGIAGEDAIGSEAPSGGLLKTWYFLCVKYVCVRFSVAVYHNLVDEHGCGNVKIQENISK